MDRLNLVGALPAVITQMTLADVARVQGGLADYQPPHVQAANQQQVVGQQMDQAVARESKQASVFIGAAAIADYRPSQRAEQKIKKTEDSLTLTLERTPDVLANVAAARTNGMLVVGFAAESGNLRERAREKLERKQLDLVAANDISSPNQGFQSDLNQVLLIDRNGHEEQLPLLEKNQVARLLWDRLEGKLSWKKVVTDGA